VKVALVTIIVEDQVKALAFYLETPGFIPKNDSPMGDQRRIGIREPAE
jgi:hypothetical protein